MKSKIREIAIVMNIIPILWIMKIRLMDCIDKAEMRCAIDNWPQWLSIAIVVLLLNYILRRNSCSGN